MQAIALAALVCCSTDGGKARPPGSSGGTPGGAGSSNSTTVGASVSESGSLAGSMSGSSIGASGGSSASTSSTGTSSASSTTSPWDGGSACNLGVTAGTAANTLAVDVDSAQSVIKPGIYGLLMERLGADITGGLYVGANSTIPNTNGMRNDVIQAFKEAGVGMIEWPGGCAANSYNWQPPNPTNDVGTDRYMQLCSLVGIDPYIAGPGTATAATTNQQWVAYINNNATHPDWNLKHFKIGNEVWGCGGNQTEATYETNYLANYNLLSAPVNGKALSIVASTGLIGNWTWLDTEVKNLVGKIDGIEIHDYVYHPTDIPATGFTDDQYYNVVDAANAGQIGPRIAQILSILDKYDSQKHIQIYEDEWGDWLQGGSNFFQQITTMDAISTAEQLHLFMQHADRYAMAGMAQAINVIHSLLLTQGSLLVKTPAFYVFEMFLPHHSSNAKWAPNTLVSESITGNGTTFPVLSAGTTVDDQGRVNISFANVDLTQSRTVLITLNSTSKSSYSVASAQVVTGPAKDSINDFGKPELVNIQPLPSSSCTGSGKSLTVNLPPKSVVMLVLEGR